MTDGSRVNMWLDATRTTDSNWGNNFDYWKIFTLFKKIRNANIFRINSKHVFCFQQKKMLARLESVFLTETSRIRR